MVNPVEMMKTFVAESEAAEARHAALAEQLALARQEAMILRGELKQARDKIGVLERITGPGFSGEDEAWLFRNEATITFSLPLNGNKRISVHPRRGAPAVGSCPENAKGSLFLRALDLLRDEARGVSANAHPSAKRKAKERQSREDEENGVSWRRRPGSRGADSLMPGRDRAGAPESEPEPVERPD